jgi:hypothetical protein
MWIERVGLSLKGKQPRPFLILRYLEAHQRSIVSLSRFASVRFLVLLPVERLRHRLKVVEGVIQFGTNRTWNDVIAVTISPAYGPFVMVGALPLSKFSEACSSRHPRRSRIKRTKVAKASSPRPKDLQLSIKNQ